MRSIATVAALSIFSVFGLGYSAPKLWSSKPDTMFPVSVSSSSVSSLAPQMQYVNLGKSGLKVSLDATIDADPPGVLFRYRGLSLGVCPMALGRIG